MAQRSTATRSFEARSARTRTASICIAWRLRRTVLRRKKWPNVRRSFICKPILVTVPTGTTICSAVCIASLPTSTTPLSPLLLVSLRRRRRSRRRGGRAKRKKNCLSQKSLLWSELRSDLWSSRSTARTWTSLWKAMMECRRHFHLRLVEDLEWYNIETLGKGLHGCVFGLPCEDTREKESGCVGGMWCVDVNIERLIHSGNLLQESPTTVRFSQQEMGYNKTNLGWSCLIESEPKWCQYTHTYLELKRGR